MNRLSRMMTVCLMACVAALLSGSSDASGGCVIRGTVTDAATKRPIRDVKVSSDAAHYAYTLSDGAYTLDTDVATAPDAQHTPGIAPEVLRRLAAVAKSDAAAEGGEPAKTPAAPASHTVTFQKFGYYHTETKTVTGSQAGVDVEMRPSPPCTTLEMHPFLYAGEFQNQHGDYFDNQKVYIVCGGKIVWTYSATKASVGGKLIELGDISMKSNGNIVMSLGWGGAREIIPDYASPADSKIVWSCKSDEQLHTAQPIGRDEVFVIDNSKKPKAKLFNQTTSALRTWDLPTVGSDAHAMFRHCRMTKSGTLLVAHMNMAKVVEYDTATMKPIWTCPGMPNAWAAVRLKNGNTLISGNENRWVREVNPQGKTLWEYNQDDLPAGAGLSLGNVQECDRLANGNTVICTWQGEPSVLEVTPEKKIVWMLSKKNLGNSSSIQLLDEPGAMENGDLQR